MRYLSFVVVVVGLVAVGRADDDPPKDDPPPAVATYIKQAEKWREQSKAGTAKNLKHQKSFSGMSSEHRKEHVAE